MATPIHHRPTVLVLGGSYAGLHAAELLAQKLPNHWSVTLVERNSHFNHIYSFPRSAVIGQSHRNFIPYQHKLNKLNRTYFNLQHRLQKKTENHPSILHHSIQRLDLSSSSSNNKSARDHPHHQSIGSDSSFPSSSPSPSYHNINRITFVNASVTKIVNGRVFLDRFVNLDGHKLDSSLTHHPSLPSSSSSSITSHLSDSGYGSSIILPNPSPHSDHHKSSSSQSIEQIIGHHSISDPIPRTCQLKWDFLVYALGSHMPMPLQLPMDQPRTKQMGVDFLESQKEAISHAEKIVIVGGGALGIQYACDIAHRYELLGRPKRVTLIHSRTSFLPAFKPEIDQKVKQAFERFKVNVVLGERVNLTKLKIDLQSRNSHPSHPSSSSPPVIVESMSKELKQWEADLVLICTGQVPNTSLMAQFCPLAVSGGFNPDGSSSGLIRVNRALQISPSKLGPSPVETPTGEPLACDCSLLKTTNGWNSTSGTSTIARSEEDASWKKRVFAVGDCIDGFGAIKAGHVGWNQAEVAVQNILKLIDLVQVEGNRWENLSEVNLSNLERYEPSPPMIKLTLGLDRVVSQLRSQSNPDLVEVTETSIDPNLIDQDSSWKYMWNRYDVQNEDFLDGWA